MKKNHKCGACYSHAFKKMFLVMRIVTVLSLVCIMQSFALESFTQSSKVSHAAKEMKLEDIMMQIENQTKYHFAYNKTEIDVNKVYSVDINQVEIKELLNDLFSDGEVNYTIIDRQIVLSSSKEPSVLQQQKSISGKVTDTSGAALPGVTVVIKGTTNGTVTDANGNYTITKDSDHGTLVFSFVGMKRMEVAMDSKTTINVTLEEETIGLSEVIAIGYGTTSKKDITGSVSTVSVKDAQSVTNVSVSNMIQGRASGVNVNSRTAQPGGGLDIQIRGATSPRGSNKPLIVIDGVPLTSQITDPGLQGSLGFNGGVDRDYLASINPADIESISILKDASSTAIYGSAASNGVVLITTKKGKAGNVSVAYSASTSVQNAKDYYSVLDATSFMQQSNRLAFERYLYDNHLAPYTTTPYSAGFTDPYSASDISNAGVGTNWLDLMLRKGAINEHNVSITGGTEKIKTFTSFNSYSNKGLLKNSDFKRYTGRFNVNYQATSWMSIGSNFSYSMTDANNASTNSTNGGTELNNQIKAAMGFPPNIAYDPNTFDIGMHSPFDPQMTNPMAFLEVKDNSKSSRVLVSPNVELNLLSNLKFKVQLGYDASEFDRNVYYPVAIKNTQVPNGLANNGLNKNYNFSSEEYFTYDQKIGSRHNLNLVVGAGYYKSGSNGFGVATRGFFTDAFGYNNIGIASDLANTGFYSFKNENTKISQFGRLNYTFNNEYIFTFTARRDGSSSFAEGKKYGIFPGAAVAWKIGEEEIIKNLKFISDLKLRVGYGSTGNESIVGNFPLSLYSSAYKVNLDNTVENGVALTQLGNPDITWETVLMSNIALDFGFFENRFTGSIELYSKTSKNLLDYDILPYNGPISSIASNIGSTHAQGLDIDVKSKILTGKFRWTNDINISNVKINWKERNPKQALNPWVDPKGELSTIYGWKTDGLITSLNDIPSYMPQASLGNIKYVDLNLDGKLDEKDVVKLGKSTPTWDLGMNNTFNFMNFDLSVFVYAKLGYKRMDGYKGVNHFNDYYEPTAVAYPRKYNTSIYIKDVWSSDNPNGRYPGVADDKYSGANPAGNNDFFLQDASFLRIKTISLGYQLPERMIQKTGFIKAVRIYAEMDNIAVFTKWKGLDPEIWETNPYPQASTTSFGVNVNF